MLALALVASSGPQNVQKVHSSLEQTSHVGRDTPLTITAAGDITDMPNEPFGDEGSCSGSAEPERSGTKPEASFPGLCTLCFGRGLGTRLLTVYMVTCSPCL